MAGIKCHNDKKKEGVVGLGSGGGGWLFPGTPEKLSTERLSISAQNRCVCQWLTGRNETPSHLHTVLPQLCIDTLLYRKCQSRSGHPQGAGI